MNRHCHFLVSLRFERAAIHLLRLTITMGTSSDIMYVVRRLFIAFIQITVTFTLLFEKNRHSPCSIVVAETLLAT